jgi:hypothetical protein
VTQLNWSPHVPAPGYPPRVARRTRHLPIRTTFGPAFLPLCLRHGGADGSDPVAIASSSATGPSSPDRRVRSRPVIRAGVRRGDEAFLAAVSMLHHGAVLPHLPQRTSAGQVAITSASVSESARRPLASCTCSAPASPGAVRSGRRWEVRPHAGRTDLEPIEQVVDVDVGRPRPERGSTGRLSRSGAGPTASDGPRSTSTVYGCLAPPASPGRHQGSGTRQRVPLASLALFAWSTPLVLLVPVPNWRRNSSSSIPPRANRSSRMARARERPPSSARVRPLPRIARTTASTAATTHQRCPPRVTHWWLTDHRATSPACERRYARRGRV